MLRISQLKLPITHTKEELEQLLAEMNADLGENK